MMPFRLACTSYERIDPRTKTTRPENKHFWDIDGLSNYILSKTQPKRTLYVYTHNAEFDVWASEILEVLTIENWKLRFFHAKGMIFLLAVVKEGRVIWFISTTNYYPFSLSYIGKMLGLPKLDTDVFTDNSEALLAYCRRDVEIVRLAMHSWFDFVKSNNYGGYALTIPSQGLKAFRHRFYEYPIYPHHETDIQDLERRSYYGGRVETFYKGEYKKGPFVKLDFNSIYPYVMQQNSYPTKLVDTFTDIGTDKLSDLLKTHNVVAEVVILTKEPVYPIRLKNKVLFPIGLFKTVLCSGSLSYALRRKNIVRVIRGAMYEARFIFRQYVNHFYPQKALAKLDDNRILLTQVKLMMNALYGKFAEKHTVYNKEEQYEGPTCYRRLILIHGKGSPGVETKLINLIQTPVGEKPSNHMFVAVSAHVTDYARLLLYQTMKKVNRKYVYYVDTDSLIIPASRLNKIKDLLSDDRIGRLKNEGESDEIILEAPKWYRFAGEWTTKGLPKNARKIAHDTWEYESFEKAVTSIKHGRVKGIKRIKTVKTFSLDCNKGKLQLNGRIFPFVLPHDVSLISQALKA